MSLTCKGNVIYLRDLIHDLWKCHANMFLKALSQITLFYYSELISLEKQFLVYSPDHSVIEVDDIDECIASTIDVTIKNKSGNVCG